MIFQSHLDVKGKHAFLSPSRVTWIEQSEEDLCRAYQRSYASDVGTSVHKIAEKCIFRGDKLSKSDRHLVTMALEDYGIPPDVFDSSAILETLVPFVNESIAYGMIPEVPLYYSPVCFGTTDAIAFNQDNGILRISDMKTGEAPSDMRQLLIYAGIFFLEYSFVPLDGKTELRIYQHGEVTLSKPSSDEVMSVVENIRRANEAILMNFEVRK